jgi:hypothetical protein
MAVSTGAADRDRDAVWTCRAHCYVCRKQQSRQRPRTNGEEHSDRTGGRAIAKEVRNGTMYLPEQVEEEGGHSHGVDEDRDDVPGQVVVPLGVRAQDREVGLLNPLAIQIRKARQIGDQDAERMMATRRYSTATDLSASRNTAQRSSAT